MVCFLLSFWGFIFVSTGQVKSSSKQKIDSVFDYHFSLLDSAYEIVVRIQNDPEKMKELMDTTTNFNFPDFYASVEFLEKVSGISSTMTTYVPYKALDDKVIRDWKVWYNENYHLLMWEEKKKRINRKDKDIYSGKLQPASPSGNK